MVHVRTEIWWTFFVVSGLFTPEMFTVLGVEDIEVLGTPIGTEGYIKNFVVQNCIKIIRNLEKLEPLTDDFTHFQLIQKTMKNTVHECKYYFTTPGEIFIGTASSCRHNHYKHYSKKGYAKFISSLD